MERRALPPAVPPGLDPAPRLLLQLLRAAAVATGALILAGAAGCTAPPPPNVLIVSVDTLRADEVGRRVSGEPVAPAMARLGTEGVVFRHALSTAPWTTPSMMSLMTGLPAPAHGVEEHDRALAPSVGTLAERYRDAGYRTAAFVPAVTLRESFGFARGFEVFDYENYGHERISSPEMIGKLIHRLEQWREEPVFLWVHLWDPHYNYRPRPPYDARFRRGEEPDSQDVQVLKWTRNPVSPPEAEYLRGQYQGEVAYTDRYISDLLDALDRLELSDRSLVAVLGDHGESFLEHGWLGHTNRVDETNVHVPLILRGPGLPAGEEVEAPVSLASLGRTLLALSGLDAAGFGLLAPLPVPGGEPGAAPLGSSEVVSQTLRRGCQTAFYRDRLKYVVDQCSCEESLYDLAADPGETNDLASTQPEELAELRAGLLARLEAIDAAGVPTAPLPEEDQQQTLAALQALGYVSESEVEDLGVCEQLSGTGVRDSFGDMVARGPCPPRRALSCLKPDGPDERSATD